MPPLRYGDPEQRLPIVDHSVTAATCKNDLQVLQSEVGGDKEAGVRNDLEAAATRIQCSAPGLVARKLVVERKEAVGAVQRANRGMEAATKIQCSARGRLARRQGAKHKTAMAANIQSMTDELEVEPVVERHQGTE